MLSGLDPAQLLAPVAGEKTIGLAVSGGADSLALMLLYAAWQDPQKPAAIVYTVDHQLRPEARGEAEMVLREARRLGLAARLLTWLDPKPAAGKQEAARIARYRLMAEAMQADGARVLLTAHHRRDQAETVLMRLAHGSGVTGLGGMRAVSLVEGVRLFRPLLDVPPEDLAGLVERAGLIPARDPSNFDTSYERTRWREALGELTQLGLTEAGLARAAHRFQRVDALAESVAEAFWKDHVELDMLGVVSLSGADFSAADPEVAVRVLGRAIAVSSGASISALAQIEELADRIRTETSLTTTLGGARIQANGGRLLLFREVGRGGLSPMKLGAGASAVWDGRFEISPSRDVEVEPATDMTREGFEKLSGAPLTVPVAALRAVPLVRDSEGEVLAVGAVVLGPGVAVRQPALTHWRAICGNRPPEAPGALVSPE